MRSITVSLSAALFYCIGTAVASQSDKIKLYGVPRNAAAAASRTIKMGKKGQPTQKSVVVTLVQPSDEQEFHISIAAPHAAAGQLHFHEGQKKSFPALFKTMKITKVKVEKDSDDPERRLAKEGSIRGGKMEDSAQHKRSLQDWDTAFEADVAMPVRLQSMMKKSSGDSNRRLQTAECTEQDNGLYTCVAYDIPGEGVATTFYDCTLSDTTLTVAECQSCTVVDTADNTQPECQSCSMCSEAFAYDCSNLFEGVCVTRDCNGTCNSDDTGTDPPTPSDPDPTSPPSNVVQIPCYEQDNGLAWCVLEGYPDEGFSTFFYNCPLVNGASVSECQSCAIVVTAGNTLLECQSCTICPNMVAAFDCSNLAEGECTSMDCDGNCISGGDGDTGTDPPASPNPDFSCEEMADGSLVCHQQGYPADGFNVDFFGCSASASSPTDCSTCAIIAPDGTTQCNSCNMCSNIVAFDCSNAVEGDCVMMDCAEKCYGSSTSMPPIPGKPTSSIDTGPVGPECQTSRKWGILSIAASTIAAFGFF